MSPERFVSVYKLADGRWTWRVIEDGDRLENGPAYPTRREAVTAAAHLFPETPIEVDGD